MPYYRENQYFLGLPSSSTIPSLHVIRTDSANVFAVDTVPPISLHKLDSLINNLKENKIYLSNSDKMSKDNKLLNATFMDSMEDNNDILDIDPWFDDDAESSMIFIFLSSIIALIAFLLVLFLCFKHEKLRKLMSLYLISPPMVDASADDIHSNRGHILIYLLSIICILILAHAIIKSLTNGIQYFRRYQTTTHFLCEHGQDKGPSAAIALELSTLPEITHVHIAHLNILITRLSILETDHNAY